MDIKTLESFKLSDSVTFHDELNPKLFHGHHLKNEIRDQLMLVAQDFIEDLGVSDLQVKDITISGSNAAYSYTQHSDLDLHILADMEKMQDPVYAELFKAKKTLYNDKRKITVKGIPVELYVQDVAQPHISLGEYSILRNKWIRFPSKRRANFDQSATKAKYEKLAELIKYGLKTNDITRIKGVLSTIKRYRQSGLEKGGEFGPENLAFKAVRSQGLVGKLFALRDKLHGKALSTENMYENLPLDKPTPTVSQLAEKYRVSRHTVAAKVDAGVKIELEHTTNKDTAREIALDHLGEDLKYYEKLASVGLEEDDELDMLTELRKDKPYELPELRADRDHLIYVIINKVTKQRYVGITAMAFGGDIHRTLNRRMQKHLQRARIENKDWGLCASLRKYGPENFSYGLLEVVPGKKSAHSREMEIIGKHNPELNTFKAAIKEVESGNYPDKHFTLLSEIELDESSGYIPSKAEKNDDRFKTALTVDIKPDSIKKNAAAFGSTVSRAGVPPTLGEGNPVTSGYFAGSLNDILYNLEVTGLVDDKKTKKFWNRRSAHANEYYSLLVAGRRFKSLPGGNANLKYTVQKNGTDMNVVIIDARNKKIAGLLLTSARQVPGGGTAYHIDSSAVNPEYRGQGIGYGLYGVMVVILRKRLISGDRQTPDAIRMWTKMSQIPGVVATVIRKQGNQFTSEPLNVVNGQATNYPHKSKEYVVLGHEGPANSLSEDAAPVTPSVVYHVTPTKNLPSILKNGLDPTVGPRASQIPGETRAIYVFPDRETTYDAIMNWLGDQFEESEDLALLEINTTGVRCRVTRFADYELKIVTPVPPENIKVIYSVI